MPESGSNPESVLRKEPASMLETVILLSFCVLVGLASVVLVVWLALTGRLASLDGLAFAIISLTLGGFFMFNVAWSAHTGELRAVLNHLRKKKASAQAEGEAAATPTEQA